MSEITKRTNGDRVAPVIDGARKTLTRLGEYVRDHPDEAAVCAGPFLVLAMATRRHKLSYTEAILVSEVGFWCGVFAVQQYQAWKAKPAKPLLKVVS